MQGKKRGNTASGSNGREIVLPLLPRWARSWSGHSGWEWKKQVPRETQAAWLLKQGAGAGHATGRL